MQQSADDQWYWSSGKVATMSSGEAGMLGYPSDDQWSIQGILERMEEAKAEVRWMSIPQLY
jgi:hypothetical protein